MRPLLASFVIVAVCTAACAQDAVVSSSAQPPADLVPILKSIQNAKDADAAMTSYAAGLAAHPDSPELHEIYVWKMIDLGTPSMGYDQARALVKLDKANPLGWAVIAFTNIERGKVNDAADAMAKAVAGGPQDEFVQATAGQLAAWYDSDFADKKDAGVTDETRAAIASISKTLKGKTEFDAGYKAFNEAEARDKAAAKDEVIASTMSGADGPQTAPVAEQPPAGDGNIYVPSTQYIPGAASVPVVQQPGETVVQPGTVDAQQIVSGEDYVGSPYATAPAFVPSYQPATVLEPAYALPGTYWGYDFVYWPVSTVVVYDTPCWSDWCFGFGIGFGFGWCHDYYYPHYGYWGDHHHGGHDGGHGGGRGGDGRDGGGHGGGHGGDGHYAAAGGYGGVSAHYGGGGRHDVRTASAGRSDIGRTAGIGGRTDLGRSAAIGSRDGRTLAAGSPALGGHGPLTAGNRIRPVDGRSRLSALGRPSTPQSLASTPHVGAPTALRGDRALSGNHGLAQAGQTWQRPTGSSGITRMASAPSVRTGGSLAGKYPSPFDHVARPSAGNQSRPLVAMPRADSLRADRITPSVRTGNHPASVGPGAADRSSIATTPRISTQRPSAGNQSRPLVAMPRTDSLKSERVSPGPRTSDRLASFAPGAAGRSSVATTPRISAQRPSAAPSRPLVAMPRMESSARPLVSMPRAESYARPSVSSPRIATSARPSVSSLGSSASARPLVSMPRPETSARSFSSPRISSPSRSTFSAPSRSTFSAPPRSSFSSPSRSSFGGMPKSFDGSAGSRSFGGSFGDSIGRSGGGGRH
ncbi:MAG: hypothetical protein ACE15C_14245 [Phycisphaerae bacterium]